MAILTGDQIWREVMRGRIGIDPFDIGQLGANSYDVRLAPDIMYVDPRGDGLDFKQAYAVRHDTIPESGLMIYPGELILGATVERTRTPHHVPFYEGRSTTGRYFLESHQTAGFGDVGYDGHWTLEITCKRAIRIYPLMRIGQVAFHTVEGDVVKRYGGRYSNHAPRPVAGVDNNI